MVFVKPLVDNVWLKKSVNNMNAKYQVGDWVEINFNEEINFFSYSFGEGVIRNYQIIFIDSSDNNCLVLEKDHVEAWVIEESQINKYSIDPKYLGKKGTWISENVIIGLVNYKPTTPPTFVRSCNIKCISCLAYNSYATANPMLDKGTAETANLYLCFSCNTRANRIIHNLEV